jgi:CBS domain-containing protein
MKLRDITTDAVETLTPITSLADAATAMRDRDLGWMPVEEGGKVVGIVTDRDIVVRGIACGMKPADGTVREVMTKNVLSCNVDDDVDDAAELMQREQVRRLVVLDGNGRLAGVVSLADLARKGDDEQSAEVLEQVTQPA